VDNTHYRHDVYPDGAWPLQFRSQDRALARQFLPVHAVADNGETCGPSLLWSARSGDGYGRSPLRHRHLPLPIDAPLAEFAAIAERYPVYRIDPA
jgi:hypothetical protein